MADESPVRTRKTEDGTTLIEIAGAANIDEAELIRGFLENEGIPAQVEPAESNILPASIGTLGDVRVYVAQDDEERAFALLEQREHDYEQLDEEGETVVTDDGPATIADGAEAEPE